MKKIIYSFFLSFVIAFSVIGFAGCSDNGRDNTLSQSIEWERGIISGNYTLETLDVMTAGQRSDLEKKYISVEFELESYRTLDGLFYVNVFSKKLITTPNVNPEWADMPSSITITCYVFEPYWEIDCKAGDTVIAEGYVEYFTCYDGYGYTIKSIRINPCDIRKK